ncbi:daunorubicin resistance protein DrrA family ABC transporter ATP-binding protein [Sphaerisporangium flaviroseum]|uniref:Daunorubicin resistance protein DrrA family ABC transporter ATP-binding protein n=1 Tax=Sphaerisporangium flaviroseum TaxID=509199 RepID=A0ABP7J5L8_9ACTN
MIIAAQGLKKTFTTRSRKGSQTVEAVKGIDLGVETGEIFGVLGPNGAGKTTMIRMLSTLIAPTSGTAQVAGHDLIREPESIRKRIGYVSQAGGVDEANSARSNLMLAARVNGIAKADAAGRVEEMLSAFDLTEFADRPGRTLSGGQKRRISIALGLVHRPPLLFLDEPTTGLDPQNRANLWDQIRLLRTSGTSVLLSTHYLDEADALCDRLAIVDHGIIVAEGTPAELKREVAGDVVTLRLAAADGAEPLPEGASHAADAQKLLEAQPYTREVRVDGDQLRIYLDDGEHALPGLLRSLEERALVIQSIALDRATLDDVFLQKTGRSLRDAA